MTSIENILQTKGPLLSGKLSKVLQSYSGLSNETIRKQLSRSAEPVKKVQGFFTYNQSLFYLEEHIKDGSYIRVLKEILKDSAKRIFAVVKALEYHFGYLGEPQLAAYILSPVENLKGHKRADMVLRDAARIDLIKRDLDYIKLNELYFPKSRINFKRFKAIEIARNFILNQFMDWARMIGMVSFDTPTLFSEFAKFQWAFTSPSYISSLTSYKNGNILPAFVLADILIGSQVKEDNVLFFVEKIKIVKAVNPGLKIIPFLILDGINSDALAVLKKQGIVVGFISKLFGREYSELIKDLINTVTNAAAILKKNPVEFLALMDKIIKLTDGKTNNLRGDVFEMAVGYYHSRLCKNLDISKIIYIDGVQRELDVFAVYADAVKVCECKGLKRSLTITEIDDWLKKNVLVREWIDMQDAYKEKCHVFELWSTGGFTEEARSKLEEAAEAKRYDILYFDQAAILKKAKEIPGSKFVTILNQYFIKEPV